MLPYLLKSDWGLPWLGISSSVFLQVTISVEIFNHIISYYNNNNFWHHSSWEKILVSLWFLSLTFSSYCYNILRVATFFSPMMETAAQCFSRFSQDHDDFPFGTCKISPAELWLFTGEDRMSRSQKITWLPAFLSPCNFCVMLFRRGFKNTWSWNSLD